MKSLRTTILALCFLALLPAVAPAQAQSSDGPTLRFTCASWEPIAEELFFMQGKDGTDVHEIEMSVMTRSRTYTFKGDRKIVFYRKGIVEGGAPYAPAATVSVPSTWKSTLLLFFPQEGGKTYKVRPIRDDDTTRRFGSYRFINFTRAELRGVLGGQKFSLKPGAEGNITVSNRRDRALPFGVWTGDGEDRKWVQRNTFTWNPEKYLIYIFYATKDGQGRPKIKSKGIVDFKIATPPNQEN